MSLKTLAVSAANKFSKQMLTVQKHSPLLLCSAGVVGVGATVVLACKATLKLPEVLEEAEASLKAAETAEFHLDKTNSKEEWADTIKEKTKFGVQLKTAIKVAKLYTPAAIMGTASVGAMVSSHVVLQRRNASLAAAYMILDKGFKKYRQRVIEDQGVEKDLEYRYGAVDVLLVEEGPNGPETKTFHGVDQAALKNEIEEISYDRIFDEWNPNFKKQHMQNTFFIRGVQNHVNDKLRLKGYVFLNDVYKLLGFEPTVAGQSVGWLENPKAGEGDGYIDFGIAGNLLEGDMFVTGRTDSITLQFNVDGPILHALPRT